MLSILRQYRVYLFLMCIGLIYLLLPSHNLSADSYGYANDIKNGVALFSPHHLFYNGFYYYLSQPFRLLFPDMDILWFCTIMNSLFSLGSLMLLERILHTLQVSKTQRLLWLAFAACSYGIWRFSLENESYIISLFLSLAGSYFLLTFDNKKFRKFLILAGFFASLAALFHQIHFIWWLGLLAGIVLHYKRLDYILFYLLPALIMPLSYIWAYLETQPLPLGLEPFVQYILHDYFKGNASETVGLKQHLMFIAVAVVRTFIQVYPYILLLFRQSILYFLPLAAVLFFIITVARHIAQKKNIFIKKDISSPYNWFLKTHILILSLQLAFAFFSNGNSEFMIMTPILIGLCMAPRFTISETVFSLAVLSLFIWNIMYGVIPHHRYNLINQSDKIAFLKKHPGARFISQTNLIQNQNEYLGGSNEHIYADGKISPEVLRAMVDSGHLIFTDMPDDWKIISRGSFTRRNLSDEVWQEYHLTPVDSVHSLYGTINIYRVSDGHFKSPAQ